MENHYYTLKRIQVLDFFAQFAILIHNKTVQRATAYQCKSARSLNVAATYITRVYVIIYLSVVLRDLDVRKVAVVSSNPKPNDPIRFRLYWGHRAIE